MEKSQIVLFIPGVLYILVILYTEGFKKKRKLKNLIRKANGCRPSQCLYFLAQEQKNDRCDLNKAHFRKHSHSDVSCEDSQARISQDELNIFNAYYSKKMRYIQNAIAIASILATVIIALLKGGSSNGAG